jgi:hypothetical protein
MPGLNTEAGYFGDRDIERADGMRLGLCPSCLFPHLFLLDIYGDAFADVVLDRDTMRGVIEALQSFLADGHPGGNGNDREDR